MASVALLGTVTFNTTAGSKTVTATPGVDDLIVVVAASSGLAGGTTAVTDDNSSGTYTQVDSDRTGFSTTGVLTVWVRNTLVGAASSTIFSAAQVGSSGGGLAVFAVKNMTEVASAAVRSNGGQSAGGAGTTPAPVLSLLPNPMNPIITAVCNGTNAAPAATERTGYTVSSGNYGVPATAMSVGVVNSGENTDTITWGGTSASEFASVAVEINTHIPIGGRVNFQDPGVF